jgi:hypothetical protein
MAADIEHGIKVLSLHIGELDRLRELPLCFLVLFESRHRESFKRDLPEAEVHLLDAGHFALDEKNDEIASLILQFMDKQRR